MKDLYTYIDESIFDEEKQLADLDWGKEDFESLYLAKKESSFKHSSKILQAKCNSESGKITDKQGHLYKIDSKKRFVAFPLDGFPTVIVGKGFHTHYITWKKNKVSVEYQMGNPKYSSMSISEYDVYYLPKSLETSWEKIALKATDPLYESVFDVDDNIKKVENVALNIPELSDFWMSHYERKEYSVCWQCADKLKRYQYCRWCIQDSKGIIFSINKNRDTGDYYFIAEFAGNRGPKHMPTFTHRLLGWSCHDYPGKPINYLKKVILSLIKHLATNPKAFDEMINYVKECSNHYAAQQSYNDGKTMPTRSFMELMKING